MVVVDTSVLVYAADSDSPYHTACRQWLEARRARSDTWYLSWSIVSEFLRITTHPRVMRQPWQTTAAWEFIEALLAAPGVSMLIPTSRHADVIGDVIRELPEVAGNLLHDMHTAVLMREHGVRQICTRDTDFHRFPFVEVIDPLRA